MLVVNAKVLVECLSKHIGVNMDYEQIKELYDNETNPAIKGIYLNHLNNFEGKVVDCGNCSIEEVDEEIDSLPDAIVEDEE